jgi:hypothetical protein
MNLFDPLTFKPIEIRDEVWDSEDEAIKGYLKEIMKLNKQIRNKLYKRDILMTKIIMEKQMTFNDYIKSLK